MWEQRDSELGDWRRRVQTGSRDIVFAVALTVLAVSLITLAWLDNSGNTSSNDPVTAAVKSAPQ